MYRTRQTVHAPEGMPMGQLIGKRGSNVRHLQSRSGARINIDTNAGTMTVSGSASDVSAALQRLESQFASWRSSGTILSGVASHLLISSYNLLSRT